MSTTLPAASNHAGASARQSSSASARRGVLPPFGRRTAVVGLVAGGALNTLESVGMRLGLPTPPDDAEGRLRIVAEHTGAYATLATAGTVAIPFMVIGFLALSHLLRQHAPRTGSTARLLLLTGMWGFLGMHVVSLLQVPLSGTDDLPGAAAAMESWQSHPLLGALFLGPFLLAIPLGMLLLVGGLVRTRALPRWIPSLLGAFLVLDFAVRNVVPVDPHWLYLVACSATAVLILRRGDDAWASR